MSTPLEHLPPASEEERAHEARAAARLRGAIADAGGCLPFDRFMEIALHDPEVGYYASGSIKFGAHGDFVTAPEIGKLFGRCLARQCAEALAAIGDHARILEFGAGSGALCTQILECLAAMGRLPKQYLIMETSASMRAIQRQKLAAVDEDLAARVAWLERAPDAPIEGVIIANEVLDAMPVSRFCVTEEGYALLGVADSGAGFSWCAREPGKQTGISRIIEEHALPAGYVSEHNPRAQAWMRQLPEWLGRGAVLIIDYGYPAAEYYHPERSGGTLKCFFHHAAHDNPLILTGVQDITSHVDFSALAAAARAVNLDVLGYTTLAGFLIGADIARDISAGAPDPASQLALANEIKRLTLPSEMGEIFKVLAVGRDVDRNLSAFDAVSRLGALGA